MWENEGIIFDSKKQKKNQIKQKSNLMMLEKRMKNDGKIKHMCVVRPLIIIIDLIL